MKQSCDPYYEWLGIPPKDQPPNHYRLLGLENFEDNRDVIATAADRQMSFVKTYQAGDNSELSQRILNELATARICLLNAEKKAKYDQTLHAELDAETDWDAPPLEVPVTPEPVASVAAFAPPQPAIPVAVAAVPSEASNGLSIRAVILGASGVLACVICGLLIGLTILWLRRPPHERPSVAAETKDQRETLQPSPFAELSSQSAPLPTTNPDEVPGPNLVQAAAHYEASPAEPALSSMPDDDSPLDDDTLASPSGQAQEQEGPTVEDQDLASPTEAGDALVEADDQEAPSPAAEASPLAVDPGEAKLKIPDAAAQQQAREEIAKLYDLDAELPAAKASEQRLEFLRLAADAKESPAIRFALLRAVAESAVVDCDRLASFQAVDEMAEIFDLNAAEAKAALLYQILGDGEDLSHVFEFLKGCQSLISEAVAGNNLELACRVSASANELSDKPVGGSDFRQGLKDLHAEVLWLRSQSQLATQAASALDANPSDLDACATAGRWRCFVRGEWQDGLALLARSNDSILREIALREQSESALTVAQQVSLVEAWNQYAQTGPPPAFRYAALVRAHHWCQRLDFDSLGGLEQTRVRQLQLALDSDLQTAANQCRLLAARASDSPTVGGGDIAGSQDAPALFQRGLVAAMQERDFETAERLFRRCAELEPRNVAAMNNCALASMRCNNLRGALHLMISAAELSPASSALAHNLDQLTRLADAGHLVFDASTRKSISELRAILQGSPSPGAGFGFLYMPLDAASQTSRQLVDQACIYCAGRGQVECPARGCSRGTVGSTRTDAVGRNPVTGQVIVKNTPIRVPCGRCGGRGQVACPHCSQGVMRIF